MDKSKNENIMGKNPRMFEVYKAIGKAAGNKAPVLIQGETGTGNVRQLENAIERALVMGKDDTILPQDLPLEVQKLSEQPCPTLPSGRFSFKERVAHLEKELITGALEETHWVQTKAAKLLGISRRIIRYKMKKYGVVSN